MAIEMDYKLLIIDTSLKDIDIILNSLSPNTSYILLDSINDTYDTIFDKIFLSKNIRPFYNRIGFMKHEYFGQYFNIINDNKAILENVINLDPNLDTWTDVINFYKKFINIFHIKEIEFISCNLGTYPDYVYVFDKIKELLTVDIAYTDTEIGNTRFYSNWSLNLYHHTIIDISQMDIPQIIMSQINIKDIYLTDDIINYEHLFGNNPLWLIGNNKQYDTTPYASLTLSGIINNDIVNFIGSSLFDNPNVGTNKLITISGIIDNDNYYIYNYQTNANITPVLLLANGNNKSYDGSKLATITVHGVIEGDTYNYFATFDTADVGNNKLITINNLSNNYTIYNQTTANIQPIELQLTYNGIDKLYDGLYNGFITYTLSGIINDDIVYLNYDASFDDNHVGNHIIFINDIQSSNSNYYILTISGVTNANILPSPLIVNFIASDKLYDGTSNINLIYTISGVYNNDNVDISNIYYYNLENNNAGLQIIDISNLSIYGYDTNNYYLSTNNLTTNINILPIQLNGSFIGNDKYYDGTTTATVEVNTITGIINNDFVDISNTYNANFDNVNIGFNKTISINNISLYGSTNYTINNTNTTTGSINPSLLTATYYGNNKIYNGTNNAKITWTLTGKYNNDIVDISNNYNAIFDNINVGNQNISINNIKLYGFQSKNYIISIYGSTNANILPKELTFNFIPSDKTYDGTTNVNVIYTLSGIINNDFVDISSNFIAQFVEGLAGYKTILIENINLYGSDNYTITNNTFLSKANILPIDLTAIFNGTDKTYDGTTNATVMYNIYGIINNDDVDINTYNANFENKNVGINKNIYITNITLKGWKAVNYSIVDNNSTIASINSKNINAIFNGTKIYDETNNGHITWTLSGVVIGDIIDISNNYNAYYEGSSIGNHLLNIDNINLYGIDAKNYNISISNQILGEITKIDLVVNFKIIDKYYDGTTDGIITYTISGILNNDFVDLSNTYIGYFEDINVGLNKNFHIEHIQLYGNTDFYNLTYSNIIVSANIKPRKIITYFTSLDKIYDATTNVFINYTVSGIINNDDVNIFNAITSNFEDANAGNKLIYINNVLLYGDQSINYYVDISDIIIGNIFPIELIGNFHGIDKIYDGTTNIKLNYSLSGIINNDFVDISNTFIANLQNVNIGEQLIDVDNITLYGSTNYYIDISNNVNINVIISPALLTINYFPNDKYYDSSNNVVINYTISGVYNNDDVDIIYNAYFDNIDVGYHNVNINNIQLFGVKSNNYYITTYNTVKTANILPIKLIPMWYNNNKIYDASNNIHLTYTLSGIINDDYVDINTYNSHFDNINIGINKTITIDNITLQGSTNYIID
jgi:hypothetical protein